MPPDDVRGPNDSELGDEGNDGDVGGDGEGAEGDDVHDGSG